MEPRRHMVRVVWKETLQLLYRTIFYLIPKGIRPDFCVDVLDQQMSLLYNSGIVLQRIDMNDWDRNNLHFILDSDEATLEDFYSWATEDDLAYALSLVREAKTELLVQEAEILDELLTNATAADVSEANAMLKQFQL
jgi:hypothetical protein